MTVRENNATYLKRLRAEAVAHGNCSICRCRPARKDRKTCAKCVATAKRVEKARMKKNRAAGFCACGRKPRTGFRSCAICAENSNRLNKKRAERLRVAKVCTHCGAKRKRGCLYCQRCIDMSGKYNRARRKRNRAAGLCVICGGQPASGARWCKRCQKRSRIHQARWYAKKKKKRMNTAVGRPG